MSSRSMSDIDVSRRRFLRLTTAGAVAGSAGLSLLIEACSNLPVAPKPSTAATPAAAGGTGGSGLPSYLPSSGGPKADLHSSDPRITDGFNKYPKQPAKSWTAVRPAAAARSMCSWPATTRRPRRATRTLPGRRSNRRSIARSTMTITPNADYRARFQVVIAGSDLPDMMHIVGGTVANLISHQFVQSQCADLTPFLGGDAAQRLSESRGHPGLCLQGAPAASSTIMCTACPSTATCPRSGSSAIPRSGTVKLARTSCPRTPRTSRRSSSS